MLWGLKKWARRFRRQLRASKFAHSWIKYRAKRSIPPPSSSDTVLSPAERAARNMPAADKLDADFTALMESLNTAADNVEQTVKDAVIKIDERVLASARARKDEIAKESNDIIYALKRLGYKKQAIQKAMQNIELTGDPATDVRAIIQKMHDS